MTKKSIALGSLLAIAVLSLAIPTFAQRKSKTLCTVNVPFEFVVANRVFPAGTYKVETAWEATGVMGAVNVLTVRSTEGHLYQSAVVTETDGVSPESRLVFAHKNGKRILSQVSQPGKPMALNLDNAAASLANDKKAEFLSMSIPPVN